MVVPAWRVGQVLGLAFVAVTGEVAEERTTAFSICADHNLYYSQEWETRYEEFNCCMHSTSRCRLRDLSIELLTPTLRLRL